MKNMKKWIVALAIFSLALTLTACGPKGGGNEADADGAFSSAEEGSYGKITGITGNEIDLALAKRPESSMADAGGWSEADVQIPMGDNDMPVVGGAAIDSDLAEIELTGETIKLTIPTGVKIYNAGQEINLSSLKKGDMISVVFDGEDQNIIRSIEKVG